jgi:rubrerythrin
VPDKERFRIPESAAQTDGFKDLSSTTLARQLGLSDELMNGHWCSGCAGIWFGYTLEMQCPVCGNRRS